VEFDGAALLRRQPEEGQLTAAQHEVAVAEPGRVELQRGAGDSISASSRRRTSSSSVMINAHQGVSAPSTQLHWEMLAASPCCP